MTTFMTQSAKDEQAAIQARYARGEDIDKKQWFDVADSLINDGEHEPYHNVQAKFSDIPILNVEKSKAARHNVFDIGIALHTKVLRLADGTPAFKNSTTHVLRFDKGQDTRVASYRPGPDGKEVIHYDGQTGMGKEAFDAAVRDIMRCWDAWEHYQKFRLAPVHPLETRAMELIAKKPISALGTVMVDRGDGQLVAFQPDTDDDADDEDVAPLPPPVKIRKTRKKA
jgi:hypothetical protein